ncbi:Hexaprenyldihydroxybenzoate methyltransferase, mitochondrial, partial [Perkinsus olseni]
EIPFPDNSFDGVIISDVLEHLLDLRAALSEIHRVLKPGGVLVFDTISRTLKSYALLWLISQELLQIMYEDAHDRRLFITPGEVTRLLEETGLTLVVGGIGALLGWLHQSRYNPTPYPDRLAVIEGDDAEIDNQLYDDITWWDPEGFAFGMRRMNTVRAPYFHRHLSRGGKVPSNGRYLDVGCGGGLLTEEMASTYGYNITGIDISEASLQQARQHINNLSNLSFEKGTIYSIPFPDNSFDGAIVSDVFEHLLDLRTAATEVYRVLKPDGVLVFDTVARTRLTYAHYWLTVQEILKVCG